jgi:hypothetical protein
MLPADDRAYARLPERRRARIMAVSRGNLYLQAALLLDEYLEVVEVTPEQYPAEGRFDVVVFDDWVPPAPPAGHAIYLHPQPPEGTTGPVEVTGTIDRPFFDSVEANHPLVQFTVLHDVNVATALEVRAAEGDRVVAADNRGPLLLTGTRGGHRIVVLTFDPRLSDLPLRIAWPLLLINAIDWFSAEDVGYVSSFRTGETWHVPVPAGAGSAEIVDPRGDEREVPVVDGRAVYAGTLAGFYTVRAGGQEDVFAANLGPSDEARIEPAETLALDDETTATTPSEGKAGVRRELWIYLILFVLLVLVAEWMTYHRRWTV